jgi:hypothetical protein
MLHNPFYAGAYVYGRTTTRRRCGSSAPCAEWRWHHARCTILGLLSLLLAFTYAFVAGRHDVRQALIVREANAIGTAFLRSGLLPEPPRRELQALLRQYLDSRILSAEVAARPSKVAEAIQHSERLQAALWPIAARDIAGRLPTVLDSLVLQALNEVILRCGKLDIGML